MALIEVKFNRKYTKEDLEKTSNDSLFVGGTYYQPKDVTDCIYYCKTSGTMPQIVGQKNNFSSIKVGATTHSSGAIEITPDAIGAYTKSEVETKIAQSTSRVYRYAGEVDTVADLPTSTATVSDGDVYDVKESGMNYAAVKRTIEVGKLYMTHPLIASQLVEEGKVNVYSGDLSQMSYGQIVTQASTLFTKVYKTNFNIGLYGGGSSYFNIYIVIDTAEPKHLYIFACPNGTNMTNAPYVIVNNNKARKIDSSCSGTKFDTLATCGGVGVERGITEVITWDALGSMFDTSGLATKEEVETALNNIIDGVNELEAQLLVDETTWSNALSVLTGRVDVLANGLGTAAACNKATEVTSGGTGLPTAGAVYNFVNEASEISKDLFLFGKGHDIFSEFIEGEDYSSYYNSTTKYYNIPVGTGVVTDEQISQMLISATDANKLIEEKVSGYGRKSMIVFDGDTLNTSYFSGTDDFTISFSNWIFKLQFNASYNGWQQISFRNNETFVTADKLKTARAINGVPFDGSANINNFVACTTASNTAVKSVSKTGFVVADGSVLNVLFVNDNTNADPQLSVNDSVGNIYVGAQGNSAGKFSKGFKTLIFMDGDWYMTNADESYKLKDARTINGVPFDGSANINNTVVCTTSGSNQDKSVSITGFVVEDGAMLNVSFTKKNTHSTPKLKVNDGDAYPILDEQFNVPVLNDGWYTMLFHDDHWHVLNNAYAKALSTERTINGLKFDGSADVNNVIEIKDSDVSETTVQINTTTFSECYGAVLILSFSKVYTSSTGFAIHFNNASGAHAIYDISGNVVKTLNAGVYQFVNLNIGWRIMNVDFAVHAGTAASAGMCDYATSASKLYNTRTINGIKFDGSANVSNFFVCSTPGDSDTKIVNAPGITKETGARIVVKFENSCEEISNRVEITLDNNVEHASPIVLGDGTNVMEHLVAGVYDMVYDGSNWVILSGCGSKTYWEE